MANELIIGVDLGLKNPHRVSLTDFDTGRDFGKSFNFDRDIDGFTKLMHRIEKVKGDRQLVFVMEPTSMAWLPLVCFVVGKGHRAYTVQPKKVAMLRKFFGVDKSDRLDSLTLAKVYQLKPDALNQQFLPPANVKTLDRLCRQRARLVKQSNAIRQRVWHIFLFANPKVPDVLGGLSFSTQCRALLRTYMDAHKIVDTGLDQFTKFLAEHTHGPLDPELSQKLMQASESAVEIYKEYKEQHDMPFDTETLQMEVNIELDMLEAIEEKIQFLENEIHKRYLMVDPKRHMESFRGIALTLAPIIHSVVGDIRRFPNVRAFRGFVSLVPKKRQTTDHDLKGLSIKKASFWLLKKSFYMATETARHWDPEIAEFYHRLIKRGKHHKQATCACANKLAGRVYAVLKRMADPNCPDEEVPYVLRDLHGNSVDKKTAKDIIDANFPKGGNTVQKQSAPSVDLESIMKHPKNNDNGTHDVKSVNQVLEQMLQTIATELKKINNTHNSEPEVVKE